VETKPEWAAVWPLSGRNCAAIGRVSMRAAGLNPAAHGELSATGNRPLDFVPHGCRIQPFLGDIGGRAAAERFLRQPQHHFHQAGLGRIVLDVQDAQGGCVRRRAGGGVGSGIGRFGHSWDSLA
jgi:hypothetical protein